MSLILDSMSGVLAAFGLRKMRTAYAGYCIRVKRASDNTEQDIGFSGNDLDTAAIATFCSGTTGRITRFYYQDKNDGTYAAPASGGAGAAIIYASGAIVTTGAQSKPAAHFLAADFAAYDFPTGMLDSKTAITFIAVHNTSNPAGSNAGFFAPSTTNSVGFELLLHKVISIRTLLRINNTNRTDDTGQFFNDDVHAITEIYGDGSSVSGYKNNSSVTLTSSAALPTLNYSGIYAFGRYSGGNYVSTYFQEIIVCDASNVASRAANYSELNTYYVTGGSDTTAPSDVGTVTPTVNSSTQITWDFSDATDNVAVTDYVYRIGTTNNVASYSDQFKGDSTSQIVTSGLSPSTTYYLWVKAKDAAGNVSANWSTVASATTDAAADSTPPSDVGTVTPTVVSDTEISLDWADATDNVAVSSYVIEYDTDSGFGSAVQTTSATSSKSISGLTASTTYYFRVKAKDSSNNLSTNWSPTASETTDAAPAPAAQTTAANSSRHLVAKTALEFWFAADESVETGTTSVSAATDLSGNSRDLACASAQPTLETGIINDLPVVRGTSSTNALSYTGNVPVRHAFLVVKYRAASFSGTENLLEPVSSPASTGLIGTASGTVFTNNSNQSYKKNNLAYADGSMTGPMDAFAVIEYTLDAQETWDGIKIANASAFDVAEVIIYSAVKSDAERMRLYEYFARRYHLWEEYSAGVYYFPFRPDWRSEAHRKKTVLMDKAEDATPVYRTKRARKYRFELKFNRRHQAEVEAVDEFVNDHHPGTAFWYRDYTHYPAREVNVRFDADTEIDEIPDGHIAIPYELAMDEV